MRSVPALRLIWCTCTHVTFVPAAAARHSPQVRSAVATSSLGTQWRGTALCAAQRLLACFQWLAPFQWLGEAADAAPPVCCAAFQAAAMPLLPSCTSPMHADLWRLTTRTAPTACMPPLQTSGALHHCARTSHRRSHCPACSERTDAHAPSARTSAPRRQPALSNSGSCPSCSSCCSTCAPTSACAPYRTYCVRKAVSRCPVWGHQQQCSNDSGCGATPRYFEGASYVGASTPPRAEPALVLSGYAARLAHVAPPAPCRVTETIAMLSGSQWSE